MLHGFRGHGSSGRRSGGLRFIAAAVGCVTVLGLTAGCGNKDEVCDEAEKTFRDLAAQIGSAPAADSARWKQVVTDFAGRLDALAGKSGDKALKKVLQDASASARQAATALGNGDAAPLQRFVAEQPKRVGQTCS